ncbi:hypothetical protein SAMN06297251_10928 [Fulvimarina manganoxydans]|uniref:Uncharacterized protein n=2 Tax=Fulvimarina manganoxydans TaxID=937218 RepID=A0A1W2CA82_9HYPH|nr:hypothetical protein SAMN06297251_10928 [Fulvimarina manganoxydans]
MEQEFEWDDAKEALNRSKHGIGFDLAMRLFLDADRVTKLDQQNAYGEERFVTAGLIEHRLFVVVYTMRGRTIRIISARKANERERRRHGDRPKTA